MRELYFNWLVSIIDGGYATNRRRLLIFLFETDFYWTIPGDENRALDGLDLRRDFCYKDDAQCSILEMLVGMAKRCEEDFMQDPEYGNRTSKWFWIMVDNLGLMNQTDERFDFDRVDQVIVDFLNRNYEPNGHGSIFYVDRVIQNMRRTELWFQMCWYFNEHYNFDIL